MNGRFAILHQNRLCCCVDGFSDYHFTNSKAVFFMSNHLITPRIALLVGFTRGELHKHTPSRHAGLSPRGFSSDLRAEFMQLSS